MSIAQPPASLAAAARDELRARCLERIPRWYSPWLHLCATSVAGIAIVVAALALLGRPGAWELLAVPASLLLANALEWRAHKGLLHRRTRGFEVLYDRHTPLHHRIYVTEDMALRHVREFRLVLLPAYAVLVIALLVLPLAGLLAIAASRDAGLLFLATSTGYVVLYEWLHLAYHAPPGSWVNRLGPVRRLARHHAVHHSPALMQRWNFNVTVPVWDWVRGTVYRGEPSVRDAA